MGATLGIKGIIILSLVVAGIAGGGVWYWKIYNSGRQSVVVEQEKKLIKLKERTNAAKSKVLTTDDSDVDKRLLDKYSRED